MIINFLTRYKTWFSIIPATHLLSLVISCSLLETEPEIYIPDSIIPADSVIAISDVNVIPIGDKGIMTHRTVILSDGKIQGIHDVNEAVIPDSAIIIDGSGKYLMPGLLDMHVHMHAEDLEEYLSSGITTVRNMWGTPDVKKLAHSIDVDSLTGPEIYSASPGIDGDPPTWGYTQVIEDPAEASKLVKRLKSEGWRFLKVYNRLQPDVYKAVSHAAKSENIKLIGHTPWALTIEDVLNAEQASVEHFTGFDRYLGGSQSYQAWISIDQTKIPSIAKRTANSETWICPTLVVLEALSVKNLVESEVYQVQQNLFKLLKSLYDERVKLLIGTDSGIQLTSPGISIHNELKKFVQAGIPPSEVLQIATLGGAQFLQIDDQVGTVSVGKQADLLLLNANPLRNIENTTQIESVIVNGALYPTEYFTRE